MDCCAVASSLEHLARGEVALPDDDLMIVTGQGKHSETDAVIKPQIEEMLAAPEFAMLSLTQYAKNPGRLLVPAENLREWVAMRRRRRPSGVVS